MTIPPEVIADLRSFQWQNILDFCASLEDLNDAQWRFLKGRCAELIIEKNSTGLVYVGDVHKDYDWPRHNLTVELKSLTSMSMYGKRGQPRKHFGIKLNNSNGTNSSVTLDPSDVADLVLVVYSNGAFVIDRDTAMQNATATGDGWVINVNRSNVVELTGCIVPQGNNQVQIKKTVLGAIEKCILEQNY
jgi:hypothetical protein